jgi:hypothetical protein
MRILLLLLSAAIAQAQYFPPSGGGGGATCGTPDCTVTGNLAVAGNVTVGDKVLTQSTDIAAPAVVGIDGSCTCN